MAGIIDAANDKDIKDPQLSQIAQQVQAKLQPDMQHPFQAILVSGLHIMFDPSTKHLLQERVQRSVSSPNPAQSIGDVAARLVVLISHEAQGKLQLPAAVPAAIVLLCHILDYAEKTGQMKVDPQLIASAVQTCTANMLKYCGVGPQQIMQAKQAAANGGAQNGAA
jgi:hypothetical protein